MNIAVINVKDLFKYILKFFLIISIILLLVKGLKGVSGLVQEKTIKQAIENTTSRYKWLFFFKMFRFIYIPILIYKNRRKQWEVINN